jgi:excisionase family DNA binding protein
MQKPQSTILRPIAYRVNDFCAVFGIGRTTLYEMIKTGTVRTILVGGRRLVPATEAERLLSGSDDVSPESLAA